VPLAPIGAHAGQLALKETIFTKTHTLKFSAKFFFAENFAFSLLSVSTNLRKP
jgi:hypothetical protein